MGRMAEIGCMVRWTPMVCTVDSIEEDNVGLVLDIHPPLAGNRLVTRLELFCNGKVCYIPIHRCTVFSRPYVGYKNV